MPSLFQLPHNHNHLWIINVSLVNMVKVGRHIYTVRLTIWCGLFLEFWLVHTRSFAHPSHQRAVTRLENVHQKNVRWSKVGYQFVKARIQCEIFLSDYFMKHSLMYISLYLIWFHEIHIKYVKREPPRLRKKGIQKKAEACNFIKKETLAQVFS